MIRPRIRVRALLAGREHDYGRMARPLLRALDVMHHFDMQLTSDPGAVVPEPGAVLLATSDLPIGSSDAVRLDRFVRGGGGVVLLHGTLAAWSEHDAIADLAGWRLGTATPPTEIIVKATHSHELTQRLSPELALEDEIFL